MLLSVLLAAAQPVAAAPVAPVPQSQTAAPDAERLALASEVVARMLPPGSYGRMMTQMMGGSMEGAMSAMLDMTPEEMIGADAAKNAKGAKGETMRETIAKEDPHFEERMRIMTRVMGEEFGRLSVQLEPRLREGLSRSMARRFSAAELRDIGAFFATGSGSRFAAESLMIWADPEMMKSVMEGMPEIIKEMPAIMAKVEAATAHLPQPKSRETKKGRSRS